MREDKLTTTHENVNDVKKMIPDAFTVNKIPNFLALSVNYKNANDCQSESCEETNPNDSIKRLKKLLERGERCT